MAYDRNAAVSYAGKYWNIPCDDGIFWLTNERISIAAKRKELKAPEADGWKAMFVKGDGTEPEKAVFRRTVGIKTEEKIINSWEGLADCAHYLSRCLSAGGAAIDERGVTSLVNTLRARADTKTLCEKVPRDRAQKVIDSGIIKPGDMVGYFNVSTDGDFGGKIAYTHSTMYVGKLDKAGDGGVTCHTVARFPPHSWVNDSWWLHDGYNYTLIHFTSDDPMPNGAIVPTITGWWQLEYSGTVSYSHISKNGTASFVKKAPAKATDQPMGSIDQAYWFMESYGKMTICWRKSGAVEVWTPMVGPANYTAVLNGTIPGKVTKLF